MLRYQLTRPLAFAWIRGGGLNRLRYGFPLIATLIGFLLWGSLWKLGIVLPPRKIAETVSSGLVTLPGFYIAALAAVSSFQSNYLDQTIEGEGAQIQVLSKGIMHSIDLTYRMYISYLFSYLSIASLILFIFLSLSDDITDSMHFIFSTNVKMALNIIGSLILSFWIWNLITTTLHGLYFLVERMHRPYA
ncbi:hypothetical protein HH800_04620 [Sphingobium yanoikuyae]|uniref:Uncharacterized protein n=1 Tax=Sphingobium yanoikuyae TaxID=13690 RepID=A0A6M4G2R8_SPHYA|nr:hypothetical protein [Sphingobium yanoikuyae]QJR01545.1 hypothetical protein HH800_04620 [Sphingobium yanoikuyae]